MPADRGKMTKGVNHDKIILRDQLTNTCGNVSFDIMSTTGDNLENLTFLVFVSRPLVCIKVLKADICISVFPNVEFMSHFKFELWKKAFDVLSKTEIFLHGSDDSCKKDFKW